MLGKVDFSGAAELTPVPAGDYDGQTDGWESKPTNAGDSTNVIGNFSFTDPATGNVRKIKRFWNLKPTALWSFKRDLIAMGVSKEEFSKPETDKAGNPVFDEEGRPKFLPVDISGIMDGLFDKRNPVPVRLGITVATIPVDRNDANGEQREVNQLEKIELAY